VTGIEVRGLPLGVLVADRLKLPFIPVRKPDTYLPGLHHITESDADWEGKTSRLALQVHAVPQGARVLLVDDWFTTGSQCRAATRLFRDAGASLVGVALIAEEMSLELGSSIEGLHAILHWNSETGEFSRSPFRSEALTDKSVSPVAPTSADPPNSKFLSSLPDRPSDLSAISADADSALFVSVNRDYAETERYEKKDAVDAGLVSQDYTITERRLIESIFAEGSLMDQARAYANRLDEVLTELHYCLLHGSRSIKNMSVREVALYWDDLCRVTGKDNAHAMYLASGGWGFTVFDNSMAMLRSNCSDRQMATLLTAGVQDARILALARWGGSSEASESREGWISRVASWPLVDRDGFTPLVMFSTAQQPREVATVLTDRGNQLERQYNAAMAHLSPSVLEAAHVYRSLYLMRRQYDIYEYFGMYAALRHHVIRETQLLLSASGISCREFQELATFYHYAQAANSLLKSISERPKT